MPFRHLQKKRTPLIQGEETYPVSPVAAGLARGPPQFWTATNFVTTARSPVVQNAQKFDPCCNRRKGGGFLMLFGHDLQSKNLKLELAMALYDGFSNAKMMFLWSICFSNPWSKCMPNIFQYSYDLDSRQLCRPRTVQTHGTWNVCILSHGLDPINTSQSRIVQSSTRCNGDMVQWWAWVEVGGEYPAWFDIVCRNHWHLKIISQRFFNLLLGFIFLGVKSERFGNPSQVCIEFQQFAFSKALNVGDTRWSKLKSRWKCCQPWYGILMVFLPHPIVSDVAVLDVGVCWIIFQYFFVLWGMFTYMVHMRHRSGHEVGAISCYYIILLYYSVLFLIILCVLFYFIIVFRIE